MFQGFPFRGLTATYWEPWEDNPVLTTQSVPMEDACSSQAQDICVPCSVLLLPKVCED